jgi:hypothetical protein
MFSTIESVNGKICDKISFVKISLFEISELVTTLDELIGSANNKNPTSVNARRLLDTIRVNLAIDEVETLEMKYHLAVVSVLSSYYSDDKNEESKTRTYYQIITSENFVAKINDITNTCKTTINTLYKVFQLKICPKQETREYEYRMDDISRRIDSSYNIEIPLTVEKRNYEYCCSQKMIVLPETSQLECELCYKIKNITGCVFRDDQFYPQDGQKAKHGGYDTARHYKFWIERLQAVESKTFIPDILDKIAYVIKRDKYESWELTCERMRSILKDPKVCSPKLNEHAPLLVKIFGGQAPPLLDFQENKTIAIRFNKAMGLYDVVMPGDGNKPYYPYFIYKIIEYEFRNNTAKLRLLDYIHLQSRDTVIKNDKIFEQMCLLADPDDGLIYSPTDPAGRL